MPEVGLLTLAILMSTAQFENQRWIKARIRGLRGANIYFGFFIDLTGFLAMLFSYTFLAAYFYDKGLESTLYLVGIVFAAGLLTSMIFTYLFKGDNFIIWMISTVAIWPLAIMLFSKVSWFGLFEITL